jgi:hypothetical protein
MKIHGTQTMAHVERPRPTSARSSDPSAPPVDGTGLVHVVGGAKFFGDVRAAADQLQHTRAAEVMQAREDILSGAIDSDAELDAAVDGILSGL